MSNLMRMTANVQYSTVPKDDDDDDDNNKCNQWLLYIVYTLLQFLLKKEATKARKEKVDEML